MKPIMLIIAVFMSKLNAGDICAWKPESGLLAIKELSNVCSIDFENELLDLNELTRIEDKLEGFNSGGIYKDKYGNIWFIKESVALREYIGGHILKFLLGNDRIAEVKLVKGHPFLIASKKLETFQALRTLINRDISYYNIPFDELYSPLKNSEELLVGMNYIGLGDRSTENQGYIHKNGMLEAARVDYDSSFAADGIPGYFFNQELFQKHIDYGKLEKAIIKLLALPDDQIYQIIERGKHLEFFKMWYDHNLINYLEKRKKNIQQLLPLVVCLKRILNEGDINYLNENKNMLIAFQNTVEPDSQLSYLNILIHQIVQRGCLEALKKLKELEVYESHKEGYGFRREVLTEVAYKAEQSEVLNYLLKDDKVLLIKTLCTILKYKDYEYARKLINARSIPFHLDAPNLPSHYLDSALEGAVESNDLNLIKVVVSLGADIGSNGKVMYCALKSGGSFEIFQYLLENGAKGYLLVRPQLIHEAARSNRADVVELFIQHGVDPHLRDENGKTAYDYLN